MSLRVGELFAGYGGLGMGLSMVVDAEPVWFVEFDKHPDVYAIIAAVEDWYRERADELSVVDVIWGKARLAQAEAAVQRVREVCERDSFWLNDTDSFGTSRVLTVSQVLKALDSDQ